MDDNFTFGKGHHAIWIRNSMEYEQGIIMILRNCHKLDIRYDGNRQNIIYIDRFIHSN